MERHFRSDDEEGIEQIVVTAPLQGEHGAVGYVQLAAPIAQPQAIVRDRWLVLGVGFLLFALVGIGTSLWLLSTLIKPLTELRSTALALADGDLSQRIVDPDADEIGAVGQAFNQMAEQVETMVAEQRAFASNASHELRTPLTTVRLRTEALLRNELDPEMQQRYITQIDHEVAHMSGLVDDLILLSRLDAHRLAVGTERVDVTRIVRSVQQELAGMVEDKAITVRVEQPPTVLPAVQANLNHLRVVLRNLLENGLKYTPSGGVITIRLLQEERFFCCVVEDNGQGIAPDDLPHVHKRFHRAAQSRQRPWVSEAAEDESHEGSGLGLALVHSIVTLYGGRLAVTSAGIDQGTTVTIWWPFDQSS
ncbi:MAG: HAMP domain-containing sensor histidine kinase [Caldilineaceae bacterium]